MSKYKDSQPSEMEIHKAMRNHRMPKEIERILPFSEAATVFIGSVLLVAIVILLTNWLLSTVQDQMSSDIMRMEQSLQRQVQVEPPAVTPQVLPGTSLNSVGRMPQDS